MTNSLLRSPVIIDVFADIVVPQVTGYTSPIRLLPSLGSGGAGVCGGVGAGGVCAVVCVGLGLPHSVSLKLAA